MAQRSRRRAPATIAGILAAATASVAHAVDDVNFGTLFTMNNTATSPNGAWCWFQDQRAVIDRSNPAAPTLMLSSVSSSATATENGDVDLLWRNLATGTQGEFELFNQLQADDHNAASISIRPDGRYVTMYSKHTSDPYTHYRVSTNPHDATSWSADTVITSTANVTYDNTYYLSADRGGLGRYYNFTRSIGWDPNIQVSNDYGTTWSYGGRLLAEGGDGDRPYAQYIGNGVDKVHFVATDRHPDNYANNLYYGYVSDGTLFTTGGTVVDNNVLDASAVAPSALGKIFTNGSVWNGTVMNRAWSDNITLDKAKNPVVVFQACANDSRLDHRFFYARFDGAEWKVSEMAKAGGYLYSSQQNYTGLAAIDPENPNLVYISTKIDPRDGTTATSKYELYKGLTTDFGATWTWLPVTENSTMDNLRPVVPQWDGTNTALLWMRGTYSTYTSWDTKISGITMTDTSPKSSLWRGDAVGNTTKWDNNVTSNWDSGGGISDKFKNGDEVTFDDSASTTAVAIQSAITPMNIAFNNTARSYTFTGSSIGGSGSVRVIGGGVVTLSNASNTYTGETRIASGKLALTGSTTLSGTSHIRVDAKGTLDVSGATGANYAMVGRKMTVDGKVVGNITASASSTITANSSTSVQGNLTLSNSSVAGQGTITGHLTAQSGSLIRIAGAGQSFSTVPSMVTYTDASVANTAAYDTTTYPGNTWKIDSPAPSTGNSTDNLWDLRTTFATSGSVISASNGVGENAPIIKTTVSGLTPGKAYEVLGYFWNATGVNWQIKASLNAGDIQTNGTGTLADDFLPSNASVMFSGTGTGTSTNAPAVAAGYDGTDNLGVATTGTGTLMSGAAQGYFTSNVMVVESNRQMYQALLGNSVADANGQIVVYIDDNAGGGANARTWYDGIGVRSTSVTPSGGVLTMNVGGNLTVSTGATVEVDLGNANNYDRLAVTGTATLGGSVALNVLSSGLYTPAGDTFTVMTFANRSGRFGTISDATNRLSLHYNNTRVLAIADQWNNPASMTGDLDVPRTLSVTGTTPWSSAAAKYGAGTVEFTGSQTWANNSSLTIAGGSARFNLDNSDTVTVGTGVNIAINAGKLELAGTKAALNAGSNRANIANAAQFNVIGGTNDLGNLTGTGKTTLSSTAAFTATTIRQGTLAITGNSTATVRVSDADGAGAGVRGAAASVARLNNLSIDATSKLDLKNNALIMPASSLLNGSAISAASLRAVLIAGRGGTGTGVGNWTSAGGIGTSLYTDPTASSLGFVWNADPNLLTGPVTNVNGETASTTDFVVKYTAAADANLDGVVDDVDVAVMGLVYDAGATTGHYWYEGDFNYDGRVNDDDVAIMGLSYSPGDIPLSPTFYAALSERYGQDFASAFSAGAAIVPEPAGLSLLGLAAAGLLRRRRPI